MKFRLSSQFARALIALLTMAAWLVAFDHCALAGILIQPVATTAVQESCPGHSQPEKQQNQSELPCCKSLAATIAPLKISAGYDTTSFVVQLFFPADSLLLRGNSEPRIDEIDTGPPEADTFAESVLQRSILAHAPPRLS
ncbi:MAG: hypothetical protein ACR2II_14685 [Chthoniobacterales bacterium]